MAYCNPRVDRLLQDAVLHYDSGTAARPLDDGRKLEQSFLRIELAH